MDIRSAEALLKKNGYSLTRQRRAILEFLDGNPEHPTAARIYEAVTRGLPAASRSTVYNTLTLLKELGAIRELPSSDGESRFDPNVDLHHHYQCTACGQLFDVPADQVSLPSPAGWPAASAEVVFSGPCPRDCA